MIKLNAQAVTIDAAAGDAPSRTITGIAVPYGETATVSDGTQVRFEPGSLPVEGKAPKLFMYHDSSQPVGLVFERVDDPQIGMMFSARISATAAGDEALTLALDGVLDSVSVGVNPTKFSYDDEGTMIVTAADWLELSLVPIPAFAGAEIEKVYASAENTVLASAQEPDTEPTPTEVEETETVDAVQPEAVVEAATPTAPIPAQPKRQFAMPSAAEYMAAMHIGGDTFHKVNQAFVEAQKSKQTALQAAAGDVLTTDTPGLLPVPVLGDVFDDLNFNRPVVAAVGARAFPDGGQSKTFIRPTWTTHTSVGSQSPELAGVSATTPVIASNVVSKVTLAGQVTLSAQDMDFTSPGAMNIILRDLAGQYLIQSDNYCADQIVAQGAASGVTWTVAQTDPTDLINSLYDVAESILAATRFLPDHLFVSPDVWRKLSAQLDGENRPIFPYAAAAGLMGVNGIGTQNITSYDTLNPLGLKLIVDANFAAGTMVLARGNAIEFYEQIRGIMSVEVPSTLGRTFSYYGYVSTFIADATMAQKITVA
jgi:HK97 family phage prohead protease